MTYFNTPSSKIDVGRFSAPVQAAGHSLAGAIFDDPDLQGRILSHLAELDDETKTDAATSVPAIILEILLRRSNELQIAVAELAGDVNTILRGYGYTTEL